jgi:energy-coupling factor transporter transmembrane protein EcfT
MISNTETTKKILRKTALIFFIISMLFNIIYFYSESIFGVDFIYGGIIFYSLVVTFLTIIAFIPRKKVMMWVFYPLIFICLSLTLFFYWFWYTKIWHNGYLYEFSSPDKKTVIMIENEEFLGHWNTRVYVKKGSYFKKRIDDNIISDDGSFHISRNEYYLKWIDNNTFKMHYRDCYIEKPWADVEIKTK